MVVFTLVLKLGAGVCAVAWKLIVASAAQLAMAATAKRCVDLIELQRRALLFLEIGMAASLKSVGDLEEE